MIKTTSKIPRVGADVGAPAIFWLRATARAGDMVRGITTTRHQTLRLFLDKTIWLWINTYTYHF